MFDRYWNSTTCIRSDDFAAITQVITSLLEQEEGCCRLTQLPQLSIELEQLRTLPGRERPRLWVVGLFFGTGGWTIVKTWPRDLFCVRAEGASHPRLSDLAMQLRCDTFHFYVARDICGVLMEANAAGHIFISGQSDYEGVANYDETSQFYCEQIDEPDDLVSQFFLLEVPQSMQMAMRINETPEIAKNEAEYERLKVASPDSEELLKLIYAINKGHAERIDIALAEVLDKSKSCWYLRDLYYHAYTKSEQLEAKKAQLLYFQPPIRRNLPCPNISPTSRALLEEEGEEF